MEICLASCAAGSRKERALGVLARPLPFAGPHFALRVSPPAITTKTLLRQARLPGATACVVVFGISDCVGFCHLCTSDTLTSSSFPEADSVSSDQPATSSLAINSLPGPLGHHLARGADLRPAIGRKRAVPWETCSIEDPSGVFNKRQKKRAICALCSSLCIQRTLLAPILARGTRPRPGPALSTSAETCHGSSFY